MGRSWPVEPPPSTWRLPSADAVPSSLAGEDLVALGADLEPGTVLAAYRQGLFPMHVRPRPRQAAELGWWSPDPRGVLLPGALVVSRSLRRSLRRYTVRVDTAFDAVVEACGDPGRTGAWITPAIRAAYGVLHRLGWAHSVEVLDEEGVLVGGLYGVAVGGLFAGESMFHRAPDASKVALVHLVGLLGADDVPRLLDVQWVTPHLARLGAVEITRTDYAARLAEALRRPLPPRFRRPPEAVGDTSPRVGP